MSDTVRETKTGDELKPGDWLAPDQVMEGASEVLFAYAYPAAADGSHDNSGTHVQLVVREQGKSAPWPEIVAASHLFSLATEDELFAQREQAERAQKIADIRALADWLEANPDMPVPNYFQVNVHLDARHIGGPSAADSYATVRRIAERIGTEADARLDDRTAVSKFFGPIEYQVIAWHPDGRPAEPQPLTPAPLAEHYETDHWLGTGPAGCGVECACGATYRDETITKAAERLSWHIADPSGQDYGRKDAEDADDPTPVSGHRVEPHVGGVTEGGLVDETPDPGPCWHGEIEPGRDCPGSGPDCGPA